MNMYVKQLWYLFKVQNSGLQILLTSDDKIEMENYREADKWSDGYLGQGYLFIKDVFGK